MPKESLAERSQHAQTLMSGTVVAAIVVACLYWAQAVLIPVALAVFLTFLLTPFVLTLQRWRLGRIPAVVVVVTTTTLAVAALGWLVARQVNLLAAELPQHTENIRAKVRSLRQLLSNGDDSGLGRLVKEVQQELKSPPEGEAQPDGDLSAGRPKVIVQPEGPAWLSRLPSALGAILEPFGAVALAIALAVFMLFKREDLRNRFIRLVGRGRLTVTTKAVDEAAQRISRYLVMQLVVNGTYGLAWGVALYLIGIPYAALWGFLAAVLRYVPYLGAPLAAMMPLGLSVATSSGWQQPLLALGALLVLELVSNNFMEPWLYGQSIGVSEVALMVAAAFWTFLWGPIGLVLSGPLTVCLVVLGRYVPRLAFFDVLLGDAPVLSPQASFYQRLLARDPDEAGEIAEAYAAEHSVEQAYDDLLLPALSCLRRDRRRGDLTDDDERAILEGVREVADELDVPNAADADKEDAGLRARLLLCPASDDADRVAVELFRRVLDPAKWDVLAPSTDVLTSEVVSLAEEGQPAVVCVGSVAPGGLARTRYLCKRLRARFPDVRIVVGRWRPAGAAEDEAERLKAAGADHVTVTLQDTRARLHAWLPVLAQDQPAEPAAAR